MRRIRSLLPSRPGSYQLLHVCLIVPPRQPCAMFQFDVAQDRNTLSGSSADQRDYAFQALLTAAH